MSIEESRISLDFSEVYTSWFHEVSRWSRALGCAEAEMDDIAQEVFLIVRRKLDEFDGANLPGWLYRITSRVVANHRRSAWFRNLLLRNRDEELEAVVYVGTSPADSLEEKQRREQLYRVLKSMGPKQRASLVLFEIEGYSGEEIARLEGVSVATIWTRLHKARKQFLARVSQLGEDGV